MKRLFFTLCFLLIAGNCLAASSRVLPASYTEYTYDSAGGGEDYTSLATWEADTDTDVSATGQVLTCSSGIHADSVVLAGATTDANGFRVIRAATGARGTPTSGVRFEKSASSGVLYVIENLENYFACHDIATKATNSSTNNSMGFVSWKTATFVGCTAYNITATSTGTSGGFVFLGYYANETFTVINCFATAVTGGSGSPRGGFVLYNEAYGTTAYIYNCTTTANDRGVTLYRVSGTINAKTKNNIIQSNTTDIYIPITTGVTHTQTTNATSGVTFAADGYHLASNDTGAIGAGTDLSSDAVFAFDDDIDGEIRDDWDIGADEYVASGARRRVIILGD